METQEVQEIKKYLHEVRLHLKHGEQKKKVIVHCSQGDIKSYLNKGGNIKGVHAYSNRMATAYYTRSIEREYEGDNDEAMKDINAAIKICKTDPDIYYHKATLHMNNSQWGIGLNNLKKAIVIDPMFTEAIIARNNCYSKIKESRK